jgi:aspartyl-tRNA synthetase
MVLKMEIKEISKPMQNVIIEGWVQSLKDLGGIKFIQVRDPSGIIQITLNENSPNKLIELFERLNKETAIFVKGKAVEGHKKQIEIIPSEIRIISDSDKELPLRINQKKETTGPEVRYDWRPLDLRKRRQQIIFKVQSALVEGFTEFLFEKGFTQTFTPCLLGIASESGSEVFPVIYFNKESFLRQDPQLHRQLTIAGGFKRIFDIGPAWRAEQSHTRRHLCEHRVCAVEFAFIKDEVEVMRFEEELIKAAIKKVKEKCKEELEELGIELTIPSLPFPELRFPEVYDILRKRGKEINEGEELDSEAEDILKDYVEEKYKSDFYFLNRFPSALKPFYVMKIDEEPEWARSTDLYYNGIELSSGGQREHRFSKIQENLKEKGISYEEVEWFAKFFKYGVAPHGGFAIGIERLTQSILGIKNIRDCALFPRDPERLFP